MFYMIWIILLFGKVESEQWTNNAVSHKSYYINDAMENWSAAQAACEARGAVLAVIVDADDFSFIRDLEHRNLMQYWIGLRRGTDSCGCVGNGLPPCDDSAECDACRKSWTWVDGTEMGTYLPWVCSRPLGGNRECGLMKGDANSWDATNCEKTKQSMCQYKCLPHGCRRTECFFNGNSYQCSCDLGSTGQHCDIDIDECESDPCLNGATCINGENEYTCDCVPGYTGYDCEANIDKCASGPCLNEGTCHNGLNKFSCNCKPGFTGDRCQTDIDECESNPCKNNGTCDDRVNGYDCNCTEDYHGTNCNELRNKCENINCENGAPCDFNATGYWCLCNLGFTGRHCESNIDECNSYPCFNNATCEDDIGFYRCHCSAKFTGMHCESVIDGSHAKSDEGNKDDKSGSGLERAFYSGVAFLAITFIGMIIVIFLFVKGYPKKSHSGSAIKFEGADNPVASTSKSEFDGI